MIGVMRGPRLGPGDGDADRSSLFHSLVFQQGVRDFDRLLSNDGRKVLHRFRVLIWAPGHSRAPCGGVVAQVRSVSSRFAFMRRGPWSATPSVAPGRAPAMA